MSNLHVKTVNPFSFEIFMPDIYTRSKKKTKKTHVSLEDVVENSKAKTISPLSGMFSAFLLRPHGVRFETQEIKEDVILFMRRSFATNIGWLTMFFVLIFIPFIAYQILSSLEAFPEGMPLSYPFVLTIFWYVGTAGFFLMNYLHWYFNIYIVTDKRVIDIDYVGLLYKEFSATHLVNVEDITYKQGGLLEGIFNFGHIFIQTAGMDPNFDFHAVSRPNEVVKIISQLVGKARRRGRRANRQPQ